ncbi:MAG TPA: YDG domain-containing protein, partial [Chitinophagaceae bacterium]|nr:YDG domain-containing protein [Chitinophagaceae bacterium]
MIQTPHFCSTKVESIHFSKKISVRFLFSGLLMIALFLNTSLSYGQLLQWNTFGNAGTETTEPSVGNNINISSSNLTQGGITAAGNTNRFGGSGWFNTGNTSGGNTLSEAIAGNDYIQFIVTPNAGFSFTPTSLDFNWDRSSTGPTNVTLRSSVDGYTTDLGSVLGMSTGFVTLRTLTISGLSNITTATTFRLYGYGASATTGTGGFDIGTNVVNVQLNGTTASTATPTINLTGSNSALTTTYGTASATTSFGIDGSDMTNSIVVGPLAGFEFADNSVGTYFSTLTLPNASTVSKTILVRLAANTPFGTYSGNIPVTSTGAASQSISIPVSTVNAKSISITGLTANNKPFDGNTDATLSGTPSLVGVESADISNVILGGTAIATFASSAVANGIAVSVIGYTISGSASANYTLTQPTGLTANITPASLLPQVITFDPLANVVYGDAPITLTATGGASGNPVTYSSSNTNVATIAGNVLTIVGAGSSIITASQLGDGTTYADAVPVDQTQTVNVKPLTISGGSANNKVYDGTNAATVNAGTLIGVVGLDDVNLSGTSGTFASINVANGISVTSAFTLIGADALNYSLTQSIYIADITIASQTIIFNALSSKTFGDADFQLTATGGNSGNIITYASDNNAVAIVTGDMVEIVGAGTANITASQAGNSNYSPAVDVIQQLQVNQATQTIVFAALPNKTTDDISFTLTAVGGNSGNPITYQSSDPLVASVAGNVVTINGVGTTSITASQAGNANYSDAIDVVRSLTVTCPLVAGWDMNPLTGGSNNFGVSPYSASTSNSNATIGGLTRGTGVSALGTAAARAWGGLGWNNPTALDNINANKFITFTAKSNTGFIMNLCSVSPINYRRSTTGPTNGLLQYSLDGTNFADITTLNFTSSSSSGASAGSVDLSSITSLQNIGSSKTITFRLIPYGASNASGTFYLFDIANSLENDFALTGEIAPCTPTSNNTVVAACDMYLWSENGQTYTVSGTYSNTVDCHTESIDLTITTSLVCQNGGINNVNCGCDCLPGFIGTNCEIAVCNTNFGSSSQTSCNSYSWNGTTYTASGIYSGTFVNIGGCDSIHTLNLTINLSNTGSSSQTSCNSYTWNGTTYTASGTPTHTYT